MKIIPKSRQLNRIAKETGHSYYKCDYCRGVEIEEYGWMFYCDDCNEYVSVKLIQREYQPPC